MTREDYRKFCEPFDRMVLKAAASAPLNVLHLHGDKVYLDLFTTSSNSLFTKNRGTGTILNDD